MPKKKKGICLIGFLVCLLLLAACSNRKDAEQLDQILAHPGAIDTLKFNSPTTNASWRGDKISEFLETLTATNRINQHSQGKGEILVQVFAVKDEQVLFSIYLFEDGVLNFKDYYFKTKNSVPFPF